MHGSAVTTVEGIGGTASKLHPVQERIAKAHGSQCGFCTPGFVMSMYTLLRNNPRPTYNDLDVTFQGNLCRCTGYRPIWEGYKTFVEDGERVQCSTVTNGPACGMGENCCRVKKKDEEKLFEKSEFLPYDFTQEPIFPPELKLMSSFDEQNLQFHGRDVKWFRPVSLDQLLELKHQHPDAKLIVGNTEIGVEVKFKHMQYPVLIQTNYISQLNSISTSDYAMRIGASVTLQDMENAMKVAMKTCPLNRTRVFAAIVDMLYYFASKQIRNVAAVGGNIMTSSPISDLNPIFMASGCVLEVQSKTGGVRKIVMNDQFFTGYRKNIVQPTEVLVAINIPFTKENQYFYAFKQARRRDDDIAIVNLAINVYLADENTSKIISDIKMAFGGMAAITVMAPKAQSALKGLAWNDELLEVAYEHLIKDLPLSASAPGGMVTYRRSLTLSLFFRSYLAISQQLNINLPDNYLSGIDGFHFKPPKSSQYFAIKQNESDNDKIGHPVPMLSAYKQAAGEAFYVDDMPFREGELYLSLVLSSRAYADIVSIDASAAVKMPGVHAFFSAKDMGDCVNRMGPIIHDEEIMITKTTTSQGQVLGCVLAEDQITARKASQKVRVEYKDLSPVIVTIEDAIKHQSYFPNCPMLVEKGNVDEAFKNADHMFEGECRTGAQEHFYLETHSVLVVPKNEDNELEIFASNQNPAEVGVSVHFYTYVYVAALEYRYSQVKCKVCRIRYAHRS